MTVARINLMLGMSLVVALIAALTLGEVGLSGAQYAQAFSDPGSGPGLILWQVRAPRAVCAVVVGAALGLSGALMQGRLRNPLAEPGVLGVAAAASLVLAFIR